MKVDCLSCGLVEKTSAERFFAYAKGRKIYILRTFIKKTPKTPKAEIALAKSRWEELKDGG
ncbi:hypothetical protein OS11_33590 [Dickeya oryzae]